MKKIVKKAQAGTSLGQKIHRSNIGSKPVGRADKKEDRFKDLGGEIGRPPFSPPKKQSGGKAVDKTAVNKTTISKQSTEKPAYEHIGLGNLMANKDRATKKDSAEYSRGFHNQRRGTGVGRSTTDYDLAGREEAKETKPKFKKPVMKSGGKVTKKGGMAAFEKTSFDKKADKPGGRHGAEGSAKDKKMDKIDAKKMGFLKNKKK